MSRSHERKLIDAIQNLVTPKGGFPHPPLDVDVARSTVVELPIEIPESWRRSPIPDWIGREPRDAEIIGATNSTFLLEGKARTPEVGRATADKIAISNEAAAFDVWAYYVPFHFYRARWGIYVLEFGILKLSAILAGSKTPPLNSWLVTHAFRALMLHEFFHYCVEVATSRIELPMANTNFGTLDFLLNFKGCSDLYTSYFHDRIGSAVEEALANAYAFRCIDRLYPQYFRKKTKFQDAQTRLCNAMKGQGGPYAQFDKFGTTKRFGVGRGCVVDRICHAVWTYYPSLAEIEPSAAHFMELKVELSECPVYLIRDAQDQSLQIGKPFPKAYGLRVTVYSSDHAPIHVHVSDLNSGRETRYLWPKLQVYPKDPRLPSGKEGHLAAYVQLHRRAIQKRVDAQLLC